MRKIFNQFYLFILIIINSKVEKYINITVFAIHNSISLHTHLIKVFKANKLPHRHFHEGFEQTIH